MTKRMDDIKQVVDNFCGPTEKEQALLFSIRRAYQECTTGQIVSRAYRASQILEDALAKHGASDD